MFSKSNIILALCWVVLIGLTIYISSNAKDEKPFDPFDILEVDKRADAKAIKSAYRKLSLKYHPDKNPDPEAHAYFSEYVSKAYKALTDDEARKNWEQYGHPDGPKSTKFGVALPSFLFNENQHVLLLASIVAVAILIPICITIYYLNKSKKYTSNNLHVDTISLWGHPSSPVHIRQAHSIHRVLETFSCAAEFSEMPVAKKTFPHLEDLMRTLIRSKAIKEGEKMHKKKVEFVRVHFTLLAHMNRIPCDPSLQQDKVLKATLPKLMAELVKVAAMPRVARLHYGWFVPTEAVIENLQCISQAIATDIKRPRVLTAKDGAGSMKAAQSKMGQAGLLQLPHVDESVIKTMAKGTKESGVRVKTVTELLRLPQHQLTELMKFSLDKNLTAEQQWQTNDMIQALPTLQMDFCSIYVDGEDDMVNFDPVMCEVHMKLKRRKQGKQIQAQVLGDEKLKMAMNKLASEVVATQKCPPDLMEQLEELISVPKMKGKAVMAETPMLPFRKPEKWYFLVGDPKSNLLYVHACLELGEAEECGFRETLTEFFSGMCIGIHGIRNGKDAPLPQELADALNGLRKQCGHQLIKLGFVAPPAGSYEVIVFVMSDSYLGRDLYTKRKIIVDSKVRGEKKGSAAEQACASCCAADKIEADVAAEAAAAAAAAAGKDKEEEEGSEIEKTGEEGVAEKKKDEEEEKEKEKEKKKKKDDEEDEIEVEDSDTEDEITAAPNQEEEDESDSESVFSDFSYDSQDTGTDVSDAELETKCWTIQPKEDAKVQESKKNK